MATITKESLKAKIKRLESLGNAEFGLGKTLNEEFQLEAYRMLLAGMEQEPVAYADPQPAPVIPDEIEPDDGNTFDYVDGWNACRAAMLQDGALIGEDTIKTINSPMIKLPVEFYSEHGIVVQLERVMAALAVEGIRHERSGKVGNSPVISESWIKCSERMPDRSGAYLCFVDDEFEPELQCLVFEWLQSHRKFNAAELNITHWMPLPSAPQQEVR